MENIQNRLYSFEEEFNSQAKIKGTYSQLSIEESQEINRRMTEKLQKDRNPNWNQRHNHHKPTYFNC